jgi:hypothetical protein
VTVRILEPPIVHVIPKIVEQSPGSRENVRIFFTMDMPVIALALLIVVAQNAMTVHDQGKPIFEDMPTAHGGNWKTPHHYFNETILRYLGRHGGQVVELSYPMELVLLLFRDDRG